VSRRLPLQFSMPEKRPTDPPEKDRDNDNEAPETPPTEPEPVPVEEPPSAPGKQGPYVVSSVNS
jgi:hypothetical protein